MIEWSETIIRLGMATVVGAAIGLNRDIHHKPTGVRTLGLVSVGSALITMAAASMPDDPSAVSRIMQGILAGLGFLGAGVIVREADHRVRGLTTATSVWVTACLGSACGLGSWQPVVVGSLFVALLLGFGGRFEHWFHTRHDAADPGRPIEPDDHH